MRRGSPAPESTPRPALLKRAWRAFVGTSRPDYIWVAIGILGVLAFLLGCMGFARLAADRGQEMTLWDQVYLSLQLFALESGAVGAPVPPALEVSRFLAPAVAIFAAVRAVLQILSKKLERWGARRRRAHAIVCGLGRKGALLCKSFRQEGYDVVAIENSPDNENLEYCRALAATVLVGDASEPEMLRLAGVRRAKCVFAVTDDDGTNAEIAVHAADLADPPGAEALTCVVHNVDPELYELLRRKEISAGAQGKWRLQFFNVYDSGARALLAEHPPFGEESQRPHIVVAGLGQLGRCVVARAARSWARQRPEGAGELQITMLDAQAASLERELRSRCPELGRSCRTHPVECNIRAGRFEGMRKVFQDGAHRAVTAAYVCLEEDGPSVRAALALSAAAREAGLNFPTAVVLDQRGGLASLLEGGRGEPGKLHPFPLLDRTCTPHLLLEGTHETLARAVHREYLRLQREAGETPETNPHMVPWEELSEEMKESSRRQADHIGAKLEAVNCEVVGGADWRAGEFEFEPEEVELLGRMEHRRWMEERREEGWSYGPVKDQDAKTNPYMVSWEELPEDVAEWDKDFVRRLPEMLAKVGLRIHRRPPERPSAA